MVKSDRRDAQSARNPRHTSDPNWLATKHSLRAAVLKQALAPEWMSVNFTGHRKIRRLQLSLPWSMATPVAAHPGIARPPGRRSRRRAGRAPDFARSAQSLPRDRRNRARRLTGAGDRGVRQRSKLRARMTVVVRGGVG